MPYSEDVERANEEHTAAEQSKTDGGDGCLAVVLLIILVPITLLVL